MGKDNRLKETSNRLAAYQIALGKRMGLSSHAGMHLKGGKRIWYVFPYYKWQELDKAKEIDQKRIKMCWRWMDGNRRYQAYFRKVYSLAVRQLLWMVHWIGRIELACVPRASEETANPIKDVCSDIAKRDRFLLASVSDGSDLLKRGKNTTPIHRGGRYSIQEIKESIVITRPVRTRRVILLDDMVCSGRTLEACMKLCEEGGAKKVYALCLFGYKRGK